MDRYWVGGSGTWDSSSTANWSTSSGGASGASVPTSTDSVIFDNASDSGANYTVTVSGTVACFNFTVSSQDFILTLDGTATPILQIHGSVSVNPATSGRYVGSGAVALQFLGGGAISILNASPANQLSAGSCTFNNSAGTWTLNTAFALANFVSATVTAGTLALNGSTFTQTGLTVGASGTINFGTGGVLLSTTDTVTHTFTGTVVAGTGHVWMNGNGNQTFNGNGRTFYQLTIGAAALSSNLTVNGANTFTNLILGSGTYSNVIFGANQTITGALNFAGASPTTSTNQRKIIRSNTFNTQRTLSIATAQNVQTLEFGDIAITGAASPISGSSIGDLGGNSGITFTAAKTVYWVGSSGNWITDAATKWAATSGGAAAITNYPLPQDTVVVDDSSGVASTTITINSYENVGTIDSSARTLALTFSRGLTLYGSLINGTGITWSGNTPLTFRNRSAVTLTSAGKTFPYSLTIECVGSTVSLTDNATFSTTLNPHTLSWGTLNLNGNTATFNIRLESFGSGTRVLALGSGSLVLSDVGFTAIGSNFSCTGTGKISINGASAKTFAGGGFSYPHLENNGTGVLTISDSNAFTTLSNTTGTQRFFTFTSSTTQTVTNFNVSGTLGQLVTITASSVSNATLSKASGTVSVSYCNITKSTATGGATWRALIADGNVDGGSNTGWDFGPRGNGLFFGSNF